MSESTCTPATKVGWMKKQGRSGLYKNWKKRYFVLKAGCISYYEEADKPETLKVIRIYIYIYIYIYASCGLAVAMSA